MNSERQEQYETSRVNYIKTRSVSVDSGFGDENKAGDDISTALRKIKKGKRRFEEWQKESFVDIRNIRDEEGNNILHLIARLKKKQKCRSLNFLIERISEEDLAKLVDSKNKEEKTPLQVALIDKIKKGKHGSHTIQDNDNTLKFLVKLLGHGANPDGLRLHKEELQSLKQKTYYRKFLKKIVKSVRKSDLDPETKNSVIIKAAEIIYDGYPLHKTVLGNDKEKFSKLLRSGCNITNQDRDGNNVLHLVTELGKKQKLEFLNVVLDISQERELLKEQFIKAVNDKNDKSGDGKNSNGQTPLHQLLQRIEEKSKKSSLGKKIQNIVKKDFKFTSRYQTLELLLRNGADITVQDKEGNNALHYVASFKREQKVTCLNLILDLVEGGKIPDNRLREAMNAKNKNEKEQTPLHQLLQHIKGKNEDRSCTDRKFEEIKRYQTLELLLRNGANITAQDKEGNNALHYIASLKGKQKVTCLKLISSLVEKGSVPKEKLSEAINATNKKRTPLQVALIKKAEKGKHLSQKNTIFDPEKKYDNTTKFCATLLQNGANPNFLDLKDEKFHTDKYYLVLRDLKDYSKTPHTAQEKARETKEQLEKRYNIKTLPKQLRSTAQNVGSSIKKCASTTEKIFSAVAKYIDPASRTRELLAITITVTVIAMAAFAFFQGQIGIGAAIPIIAVAGVICLTLTLGFSGIKKLFGNSTDKVKNSIDNDQQNLAKSSEEQKPSDQSSKNPGTKVDDPLITNPAGLGRSAG
ncbi:MAG: ankyrin repeat domain-containing protein [Rickettsiales bacterium]|jgi:ankyrin repeat protein|nr:ankyrin repeat domain-containing protein [Rickettsiales bacterium]